MSPYTIESTAGPLILSAALRRAAREHGRHWHWSYCYQCATCSAGCPVASVRPEFSPRRLLRAAALGVEGVLSDPALWLCAGCHACVERCPQGVDVADALAWLRQQARAAGKLHPAYRRQAEAVARHGRLYPVDDFENENRADLGLPPLATDLPGARRAAALGEHP